VWTPPADFRGQRPGKWRSCSGNAILFLDCTTRHSNGKPHFVLFADIKWRHSHFCVNTSSLKTAWREPQRRKNFQTPTMVLRRQGHMVKPATLTTWRHVANRSDKDVLIYTRPTLCNLATCLSCTLSTPCVPFVHVWSGEGTLRRCPYLESITKNKKKKKLCGFSPQANYTDRAIAAGQRS
jgi:hypothetical protein